MAIENLSRPEDAFFICVNGFFSDMALDVAVGRQRKPVAIRGKGLGHPITAEELKASIEEFKGDLSGKCLFVVHNETSTGIVNPVEEILKIGKDKGMVTILDSISAFGGIDVRVDEWKADFCVGYPSKCLSAIFGALPISVGRDCWAIAKKNEDYIRGRFISLNVWREYIDEWGAMGHPHPSSMPSSIIAALNKGLDIALAEGLENRYERHRKIAALTREGLDSLGLEIFPDKNYLSNTVSVASIDSKLDQKIRNGLIEKYNIMIGGGLGPLKGKIIRIGHMGTSATIPKVSLTLSAMRSILCG
jgi:alanine-glyoxylate transaminase/serine-glyoxylate transaminase/serine-pyruvate transaminase